MTTPAPPPSGTPANSGALSALESSQYTYSNFIYPMDLGTEGAGNDHFMIFHINETATTQFSTVQASTGIAKNGQATSGAPVGQATINANNAANPGSMTSNSQPITRVATTIVLYMPDQIGAEYHANWEAEELGAAAAVTNAVMGSGSWSDVLRSFGASGLKNAGTVLNEFSGLALDAAASLATRMAINPHMEVIFNGIGFREFQFKFKFTPTSEIEAANVDNIIRAFKFYAAPEIAVGSAGRFWIYPAEFDIQYYSNGQENLFLNKISTCALKHIGINYTGGGHWAAFRPHSEIQGNAPVCSEISLTFVEMEIMQKQRILDGY